MDYSKSFLGIAIGILAVAGVAAIKRLSTQIARLYCTQITSNHYCKATISKFVYTSTDQSLGQCVQTLVSKAGGGTIGVPVYTKGTVNAVCSPTNCIHCLVPIGN